MIILIKESWNFKLCNKITKMFEKYNPFAWLKLFIIIAIIMILLKKYDIN